MGGRAAEVDIEVGEGVGFVHDGDVRDVEVGGAEEVELALEVEIEEALDGAVGGDDAGGDGGVLGGLLDGDPIFVCALLYGG